MQKDNCSIVLHPVSETNDSIHVLCSMGWLSVVDDVFNLKYMYTDSDATLINFLTVKIIFIINILKD